MKLRIFVNPSRLRRWHLTLGYSLTKAGHQVSFAFAEGGPTLSSVLESVLRLERILYRLPGKRPSKRVSFDEAGPFLRDMAEPDIIIDLTVIGAGKGQADAGSVPLFHLLFDGDRSEAAAIGSVLAGRNPLLTIVDGAGEAIAVGRPAVEKPYVLGQALDEIFTRAVTILVKAVARHDIVWPVAMPANEPARVNAWAIARFGVSSFLQRLAINIRLRPRENRHWRTGWRRLGGETRLVSETGAWAAADYFWLPDDGQRYFADPFVVEHGGRTIVFCEEVRESTRKGVISAFEIAADGGASQPAVVLERPYHLSYPFVFEHGQSFFMMPETLANGTVELYRAERFPDRWCLDTVLLTGVKVSDATMLEHGGRFWIFATEQDIGLNEGSSWDCLSIWHADTLRGPWLPHRRNPVLVDAAGARPAGPIIKSDGRLLRPTQDCTGFYGKGLVVKEITRLDPTGYEEREYLINGKPCRISGIHTLGQSDKWQLIDTLDPPSTPVSPA